MRLSMALAAGLLLAACSSSSSSGAGSSCAWEGTYAMTYGAPRGTFSSTPGFDASTFCTPLDANAWSFTRSTSGGVNMPAPTGATGDPGAAVDENTCTAHAAFTGTATPDTGCTPETASYDVTFQAAGLSGTYTLTRCMADEQGGGTTTLTCVYDATGARQ